MSARWMKALKSSTSLTRNGCIWSWINVYFNSIRAALDEKKFSHRIRMEYEELCSGRMAKEHQKDYERFFTVKETPKRGRRVEYNQEVIDEMKSLRVVSVEGKCKQIYTTTTAFQKEIIELFGLNIG